MRLNTPHPLRPNSGHAEKVSKYKSGRSTTPPAFSVLLSLDRQREDYRTLEQVESGDDRGEQGGY